MIMDCGKPMITRARAYARHDTPRNTPIAGQSKWHCPYTPPPPWPSGSGSYLITASSSPVKISRLSLMLAPGITFSVHPSAL